MGGQPRRVGAMTRRHRPDAAACSESPSATRARAFSLPSADASSNLIPTPHTMAVGSPSAFTTARDGETAFLTPPSTTQTSRNSPASAPPARYRQATQLPFELAHHSSVYLESGQCTALGPQMTTYADHLQTSKAMAYLPASSDPARRPARQIAYLRKSHRSSCSNSPQLSLFILPSQPGQQLPTSYRHPTPLPNISAT